MREYSMKRLAAIAFAATIGAGAAQAAEMPKLKFGPTTTNISVGHAAHSSIPTEAGFWKEEGIEVEVLGLKGSTAGIQQVASGQITFCSVGGEALMTARSKGIPVQAVATYARESIYRIVSLSDSPIKKPEDMKGKTVGVVNMATGSVPFTRAVLKSAGIDPDSGVKWLAVGLGATAANAMTKKDIDVWASWDTAVASLENGGFKFNFIKPTWFDEVFGNVIIAHEDTIKKHPDWVVKLVRGVAKSVYFGQANPEGTIRNHWKMYPATKPQTTDMDKAMKNAIHTFKSRFDLFAVPEGVKWGQHVPKQWERMAEIAKAEKILPADFDVKASYTSAFIDDINKFDKAKIQAMAKASKW